MVFDTALIPLIPRIPLSNPTSSISELRQAVTKYHGYSSTCLDDLVRVESYSALPVLSYPV